MSRHRTTARLLLLAAIIGLTAGPAAARVDPGAPAKRSAATSPTERGVGAGRGQRMIFPVLGKARYTNDFGDPRPQGRHQGIDIVAPRKSLAVAAEAGSVKYHVTSARAGCMLYLNGDSGTTYLYIHLNNDLGMTNDNKGRCAPGIAFAPGLKSGARVAAGEPVGFVGDSGAAEGSDRAVAQGQRARSPDRGVQGAGVQPGRPGYGPEAERHQPGGVPRRFAVDRDRHGGGDPGRGEASDRLDRDRAGHARRAARQAGSADGRARPAFPLAADEPRLALLGERRQAFPCVLGGEELAEPVRLAREVLCMLAGERTVDRLLRGIERQRALRGELHGQLHHARQELVGLGDAVDEPALERLVGVDGASGQDQLLREAERGGAREPLGAAPAGDDPEVDLRLAELRLRRRVAQVARERELAAASEREPVDRRDRRLGHRLEQPRRLVTELTPGLRLVDVQPAHVLDVRAGDEGAIPGAGEDDHACVGVLRELAEAVAERLERLDVERVERVLAVDGDDRDAAFLPDDDQLTGTLARRNSTISPIGAPGVKTSATPWRFSSSESARGIVPPTTTTTSSAPFSFRPSRIFGTSVMCAPERIEIPTASASSWIAVSTICSGVWCRPV